jgi:hypothetical protein
MAENFSETAKDLEQINFQWPRPRRGERSFAHAKHLDVI